MRALLDLLLPPRCPGCGREGWVICSDCERPLLRRMHEPAGAPVGVPTMMPVDVVQLEWCASFSGPVRKALHTYKYGGERRLADPLAAALAARWARVGIGVDLVTWVPVHPTRRRERGFDQAEDLARHVATRLALPALACLERLQRTAAQHALGQAARAENIAGAFEVRSDARSTIAGRWVLVVDDILTTGSTLGACAGVLMDAGAMAVSAAIVARDR